jgi:large subunit ribosomal protein L21
VYAVIKVGGRQERVEAGDVIEVDFMKVDPGSSVEFEPMLLVDDDGKAHHHKELSKAKVVARLLGDKKGEKIRVFKYRPKSGYARTQGHRQMQTLLEIQEVRLSADKKATKPTEAEEPPAKKPAAKKTTAKKTSAKKTTAKKSAAQETTAKKTSARKSTAKRTTGRSS